MNYCTWWPDRWGRYDWSGICKIHDEDYEAQIGFFKANFDMVARAMATKQLPIMLVGVVMGIGTTLFGWPWYLRARVRVGVSEIATK